MEVDKITTFLFPASFFSSPQPPDAAAWAVSTASRSSMKQTSLRLSSLLLQTAKVATQTESVRLCDHSFFLCFRLYRACATAKTPRPAMQCSSVRRVRGSCGKGRRARRMCRDAVCAWHRRRRLLPHSPSSPLSRPPIALCRYSPSPVLFCLCSTRRNVDAAAGCAHQQAAHRLQHPELMAGAVQPAGRAHHPGLCKALRPRHPADVPAQPRAAECVARQRGERRAGRRQRRGARRAKNDKRKRKPCVFFGQSLWATSAQGRETFSPYQSTVAN